MTKPTPPSLNDFVGADHMEASLRQALMANPATAKLVLAWKGSIADLEAARAAAAAAGDEESVRWFDADAANDDAP